MILNLVTAEPHKFSAKVTVTYPSGATLQLVNTTTGTTTTAPTTTGAYTFNLAEGGICYVKAIENGGDERIAQSDNFTVSDGGSYSKTLTFPAVQFTATVGVTFPAGLTCSLTDGTTTLYSSGTSGVYNFTVPNQGTWKASASGCKDESVNVTEKGKTYSLRLRAAVTVTITGNNNGNGVEYDGASHSVSGYSVSISSSAYRESDFTFSGSSSASRTNAGTTNMGLSASKFTNNNDNYIVTFKVTDGYVKINQKAVTVKADDKVKEYGSSDPTLTVTITGRVNSSDTISYTISRASGEGTGTYTITPTGTRSQGNYYVTFKTGTLYIRQTTYSSVAVTVTSSSICVVNIMTEEMESMGFDPQYTPYTFTLAPGNYIVWKNAGAGNQFIPFTVLNTSPTQTVTV